jgi:hypothetical protein
VRQGGVVPDNAWDGESTDKAYLFGQVGDAPVMGRW